MDLGGLLFPTIEKDLASVVAELGPDGALVKAIAKAVAVGVARGSQAAGGGQAQGAVNASVSATLTGGLNPGGSYTQLLVSPLSSPIPSGATLTLAFATFAQSVTTSRAAAAGATTLYVNQFTASALFPQGTAVIALLNVNINAGTVDVGTITNVENITAGQVDTTVQNTILNTNGVVKLGTVTVTVANLANGSNFTANINLTAATNLGAYDSLALGLDSAQGITNYIPTATNTLTEYVGTDYVGVLTLDMSAATVNKRTGANSHEIYAIGPVIFSDGHVLNGGAFQIQNNTGGTIASDTVAVTLYGILGASTAPFLQTLADTVTTDGAASTPASAIYVGGIGFAGGFHGLATDNSGLLRLDSHFVLPKFINNQAANTSFASFFAVLPMQARILIMLPTSSVLNLMATIGSTTEPLALNDGNDLTAGALYEFDLPVDTGVSFALQVATAQTGNLYVHVGGNNN